MKIKIASLSDGETRWKEEISPESVDLDTSAYRRPLKVDLIALKRPGKIQIEVGVEAEQTTICDRCCEDMVLTTRDQCSVYFSERELIHPEEEEGDDFRSFIMGQEELDVTAEVRDAVMLSAPFQSFCSDDCKGICDKCGTNLNQKNCECIAEVIESPTELKNGIRIT